MIEEGIDSAASRIPTFATREEEAEFRDTHDVTDYWDELEPVDLRFEGPSSEAVTLFIDPETMDEVRASAVDRNLPPDALLHVWILERRDAERRRRLAGPRRSTEGNGDKHDGTRPERRTA